MIKILLVFQQNFRHVFHSVNLCVEKKFNGIKTCSFVLFCGKTDCLIIFNLNREYFLQKTQESRRSFGIFLDYISIKNLGLWAKFSGTSDKRLSASLSKLHSACPIELYGEAHTFVKVIICTVLFENSATNFRILGKKPFSGLSKLHSLSREKIFDFVGK